MEKEHEQAIEEKDPLSVWNQLMEWAEDDKFDQVQNFFITRDSRDKLPGEDEIWLWLQDSVAADEKNPSISPENKRKLKVRMDEERGVIVPA